MGTKPETALQPGTRLLEQGCVLESRFVIGRSLGMGGMGEVYAAEDLELDKAPIALKTIRSDNAGNAQARVRFQREVLLSRSIAHPNVCPVYEFFATGTARGEIWFLTMKLLVGETLEARLKKPLPLDDGEKLTVAREIAAALDALHRAGIVHRDLKPSNVFLEECGGQNRAVVMDFGLAKVWSEGKADASAIAGTPRYIAPETLLGHGTTPASDLYSFGVVLGDLLLGRQAVGAAGGEAETKPLPEDRFSRSAMEVIRRCMESKPEKRFSTAGSAVEALEHGVREKSDFITRRRVLAGSAIAGAALVGGAWISRDSIEELLYPVPRPRRVAVLSEASAPVEDAALLNGVLEAVCGRLAKAYTSDHDLFVVPARYLRQQHVTDARQAAGLFGVNLALKASLKREADTLRVALTLTRSMTGDVIRRLSVVCQANAIYQLANLVAGGSARLLGLSRADVDGPTSTGDTTNAEAYAAYEHARNLLYVINASNIDEAIAELQKAVKIDEGFAKAWAELGRAYSNRFVLMRDPEALSLAERNVSKALELAPNLATAYTAGAAIMVSRGDYEHAIEKLKTAANLDGADAEVQLTLAHTYANSGKLDAADKVYEQLLDAHPNDWTPLNDWGTIYFRRAKYSRAEELFRQATIAAPGAALPWRNLGGVCLVTNQFDEAQRALDRSISLAPSGEAYTNRGTALFWLGKYREAAAAYKSAVDLSPRRYELWRNLGDAYQMTSGMGSQARDAWERSATLAQKTLDVNPKDIDAITCVALCLAKLGNQKAALERLASLSSQTLDAGQLFNEALAYELAGERDVAIKLLRECIGRGYSRFDVNNAPELQVLRKDGRFKLLELQTPNR